ncbi:MAG: NAD(+) synthase [Clostridia bacterium]|nr:NAD(+) synthase [Clostridia bacterium]
MNMDFVKVAALSPVVEVANPKKNAKSALEEIYKAAEQQAQIIALPELFLSGYTCADLFSQSILNDECEKALVQILENTQDISALIVIGMPLRADNRLYNVAVVMQKGKLLGFVPKRYIPTYGEFYEKRWFVSGRDARIDSVKFGADNVPFGRLLFKMSDSVIVGIEVCEDLWVPISPSSVMALEGANIILNVSASNELVTKHDYRRELIKQQSARGYCGYVFASGATGESTTDLVFSDACIVAENGVILADSERFKNDANSAIACIDFENLNSERIKRNVFADNADDCGGIFGKYSIVECSLSPLNEKAIDRKINAYPFVPSDAIDRNERCKEILSIQASGLAKRMKHVGAKKAIIGISGGLDSTLALLVTVKAMKKLGLPMQNILCITMPGFGTTDETYTNAMELIYSIGAEKREIDIRPACIQHMKDIGHDINIHDITYENTQARERTQILMDLANKEGALLVGTGDLSELAMGWCTYNGDHMSMYGVNAGVPKTLVRHLVKNVADNSDERTATVLLKIFDTPVSPELLPPDEHGAIQQKTEEQIGPYELHDFFLYHFMRFGTQPQKLKFLAQLAFEGKYSHDEIEKWLSLFLKRFFQSQFKRSCLPDGPKVGSVSLSPRGDFRMPSDASADIWRL